MAENISLFKDHDNSTKKKKLRVPGVILMKRTVTIKEGGFSTSGFSFMETGKTSLVLILQM